MLKDWVLEQKKGFWSMIKGWKDLEHDLELIEDKNMKIMCKISSMVMLDKGMVVPPKLWKCA